MRKAYLSDDEKYILFTLKDAPNNECDREEFNLSDEAFNESIELLIQRRAVEGGVETHETGFLSCKLTKRGKLYLQAYPTLENPKTEDEIRAERQNEKREDRRWELKMNAASWAITIVSSLISAILGFILGSAL